MLSRLCRWKSFLEDASTALELNDEDLLAEASTVLEAITSELEDWKIESLLAGPYDRGDCRIVITAGAGGYRNVVLLLIDSTII